MKRLPPGSSGNEQFFNRIALRSAFAQLIQSAILRELVRPPAQESGPMAKASAGKMIVAHLHHQLRLQRLPLAAALRAPSARAARRFAGEPCPCRTGKEYLQKSLALLAREARSEADMVEQSILAVQA